MYIFEYIPKSIYFFDFLFFNLSLKIKQNLPKINKLSAYNTTMIHQDIANKTSP
jgi:hypothetical protein